MPTGVRYEDKRRSRPGRSSADPPTPAGRVVTASAFVTDALHDRRRLNRITAGLRFDYSRGDQPGRRAGSTPTGTTPARRSRARDCSTPGMCSRRASVPRSSSRADGRTMLREQLWPVHSGHPDRRAQPGSSWCRRPITTVRRRSRDRQLLRTAVVDRPEQERRDRSRTRARRLPTRIRSVVDRAVVGPCRSGSPTSTRTAATSSAGTDIGGTYREDAKTIGGSDASQCTS